jgi:hypothetical protein
MAVRLAAKLSAKRIHAFGHVMRPDDAKRQSDVMARLKMSGRVRFSIGACMRVPKSRE